MNERSGYLDDLWARRDAVLSTARISNADRARITGRHYHRPVAKVHRITVDIQSDTRTVETVDQTPKPVVKRDRTKAKSVKRHYIRHEHADILNAVAEAFNITIFALLSPLRKRTIAWPRFAAMRLLSQRGLSLHKVGKVFRRDHTTATHGLVRARALLEYDKEWAARYRAAKDMLRVVAPPVQARSIAPLATSPGERRTIAETS